MAYLLEDEEEDELLEDDDEEDEDEEDEDEEEEDEEEEEEDSESESGFCCIIIFGMLRKWSRSCSVSPPRPIEVKKLMANLEMHTRAGLVRGLVRDLDSVSAMACSCSVRPPRPR